MNECTETNVEHKIRADCTSLYFQLKQSKILPYNFTHLLDKKTAFFTKARPQALNSETVVALKIGIKNTPE